MLKYAVFVTQGAVAVYADTAADRVGPLRPVAPAGVNVNVVNA